MRTRLILPAALALLAAPAFAHHGWGSYDAAHPVTVAGPILTSKFENPHVTVPHQPRNRKLEPSQTDKSRRRDLHATDSGRYQLIDPATDTVVSIGGPWPILQEVERQLEILSAVDEPNVVRLIQSSPGPP